MIPTRRCALAAALLIGVAVLPAMVNPNLAPLWAASLVVLGGAMTADALMLPSRRRLVIDVRAPDVLKVGEEGALEVHVADRGRAPSVAITALPECDDAFAPGAEATLGATSSGAAASMPLVARRRGNAKIAAVWFRLAGPLGLVRRIFRHDVGATVAVLPDTRPVRKAALRSVNRREAASGSKTMRYVGEGSEFTALREFLPGHDHRAISWRASARHNKLLCREFHAERDQPVVLAFDTGHLMSEPLDGIARLDHAVSAGLLLAWSCLKSGDRVGAFSFAARPAGFRAPDAAGGTFAALEQWTAALQYGADETNYTLGMSELSRRLRRRSLIVLMTDFVDVVAARLMIDNVARLIERHVVLFVTLSDPVPRKLVDAKPGTMSDVHKAVVAAQFQKERETVLSRLRRLGAHCIDCEPGQLQHDVVQRYLWIKRRELV